MDGFTIGIIIAGIIILPLSIWQQYHNSKPDVIRERYFDEETK